MTPKKAENPLLDPDVFNQQLLASRQLACDLARLAHDRHCSEIIILELARLSPVAKHFLICTGTSDQQIRSVGLEMADHAGEQGFGLFGKAGTEQGRWVVLDFVDVVVHLFDQEYRLFYDLELLWGDADRIDWRQDRPD